MMAVLSFQEGISRNECDMADMTAHMLDRVCQINIPVASSYWWSAHIDSELSNIPQSYFKSRETRVVTWVAIMMNKSGRELNHEFNSRPENVCE